MRVRSSLAILLAGVLAMTAIGDAFANESKLSRTELRAQRLAAKKKARADYTAKRAKLLAERKKRMAEKQKQAKVRGFRRTKMDGEQVTKNVAKLTGELTWHTDLDAAYEVAKKTGKPILWIHALGDLSGLL